MSDKLYAPPQAQLATASDVQRPFYVVSKTKFMTLFMLTFGLYLLYWAYKNWQQFKQASGQPMWPIARAMLMLFYTHALYRAADAQIKKSGRSYKWLPWDVASQFVVILLISHGLDGMSRRDPDNLWLDIASLVLLPIQALVTFKGQRGLNAAAGDPLGESNARFTPINSVFMALGATLWCTMLYSMATAVN
ncbi:membrane protein, putative [Pseudomonas chlororaphis]|nr:membrane protein, putative [Pseudomonas chlororaphis]